MSQELAKNSFALLRSARGWIAGAAAGVCSRSGSRSGSRKVELPARRNPREAAPCWCKSLRECPEGGPVFKLRVLVFALSVLIFKLSIRIFKYAFDVKKGTMLASNVLGIWYPKMDQALRRNRTIKEENEFLNLKEHDQKKCLLAIFHHAHADGQKVMCDYGRSYQITYGTPASLAGRSLDDIPGVRNWYSRLASPWEYSVGYKKTDTSGYRCAIESTIKFFAEFHIKFFQKSKKIK